MPSIEKKWLDWFILGISLLSGIVRIVDFIFVQVPDVIRTSTGVIFLVGILYFMVQLSAKQIDQWVRERVDRELAERGLAGKELVTPEEWQTAQAAAYHFDSQLYGFSYDAIKITGEVDGNDGSMRIVRELVLEAHSPGLDRIAHYLFSEAPHGDDITPLEITPKTAFRKLKWRILQQSSKSMSLEVEISPSLMPSDTIEYSLIEQVPANSISRTYNEMIALGRQYEYFAWDISRPTKHLSLQVVFPGSILPRDFECDVWYAVGQSQIRHDSEYRRVRTLLREKVERSRLVLGLDIPYPLLGLTYVIKWIPRENSAAMHYQ